MFIWKGAMVCRRISVSLPHSCEVPSTSMLEDQAHASMEILMCNVHFSSFVSHFLLVPDDCV